MIKKGKNDVSKGFIYIVLFIAWSFAIQIIDVEAIGPMGTEVGFATINGWFHEMTGVHMWIYHVTDWLGLVPIFICMVFGWIGFIQLIKRRNICKVDYDIIILGLYYVIVIAGYLIFEMFPINYRPILIEGILEESYPSSTTLLVLCVMPTLVYQCNQRLQNDRMKRTIAIMTGIFSFLMVIGRLIAGVHWLTDIIGSALLSMGLFHIYKGSVGHLKNKED